MPEPGFGSVQPHQPGINHVRDLAEAVDRVAGAVAALSQRDHFDRLKCRADAETRFGIPVMTRGYVRAYESVLARSSR